MADVVAIVADGIATWVTCLLYFTLFIILCFISLCGYFICLNSFTGFTVYFFISMCIIFMFIFSSELLNRTPSHICGRWYLPTFLFREYIGESSRTFGERFREHIKALPKYLNNFTITGHNTTLENFSIVGREDQNLMRPDTRNQYT